MEGRQAGTVTSVDLKDDQKKAMVAAKYTEYWTKSIADEIVEVLSWSEWIIQERGERMSGIGELAGVGEGGG